jgi:hypothetical protein
LRDQLELLPEFVIACGFVSAKSPGYEADDFLAAAVAKEERRGGTAIVATGDRDAFQLASELTTILQPVRAGQMARIGPAEVRERYGVEPKQVPDLSGSEVIRRTSCRGRKELVLKARRAFCANKARWRKCSPMADSKTRLIVCGFIVGLPRWIKLLTCLL